MVSSFENTAFCGLCGMWYIKTWDKVQSSEYLFAQNMSFLVALFKCCVHRHHHHHHHHHHLHLHHHHHHHRQHRIYIYIKQRWGWNAINNRVLRPFYSWSKTGGAAACLGDCTVATPLKSKTLRGFYGINIGISLNILVQSGYNGYISCWTCVVFLLHRYSHHLGYLLGKRNMICDMLYCPRKQLEVGMPQRWIFKWQQ